MRCSLQAGTLVTIIAALVGACATSGRPASVAPHDLDVVDQPTRPLRYSARTDKTTHEIVPRIADVTRAKGFVVARENPDAGMLVVARPDGSLPMIVLVQPDTLRWDLQLETSCWRLCRMWYAVRPLSKVDDHLVEWNDPPAAIAGAATELALAIRKDAL
jgi:hypothetical protein